MRSQLFEVYNHLISRGKEELYSQYDDEKWYGLKYADNILKQMDFLSSEKLDTAHSVKYGQKLFEEIHIFAEHIKRMVKFTDESDEAKKDFEKIKKDTTLHKNDNEFDKPLNPEACSD